MVSYALISKVWNIVHAEFISIFVPLLIDLYEHFLSRRATSYWTRDQHDYHTKILLIHRLQFGYPNNPALGESGPF